MVMTNPRRERPGAHARAIMSDRRWLALPLAARAAWLGIADLADVMPEIRVPRGLPVAEEKVARMLGADRHEFEEAAVRLNELGIVERAKGGLRLRVF